MMAAILAGLAPFLDRCQFRRVTCILLRFALRILTTVLAGLLVSLSLVFSGVLRGLVAPPEATVGLALFDLGADQ